MKPRKPASERWREVKRTHSAVNITMVHQTSKDDRRLTRVHDRNRLLLEHPSGLIKEIQNRAPHHRITQSLISLPCICHNKTRMEHRRPTLGTTELPWGSFHKASKKITLLQELLWGLGQIPQRPSWSKQVDHTIDSPGYATINPPRRHLQERADISDTGVANLFAFV